MNWNKLKKATKRALPELQAIFKRPVEIIWWWVSMFIWAMLLAVVVVGALFAILIHTKITLLAVAACLVIGILIKFGILIHKHYTKLRY